MDARERDERQAPIDARDDLGSVAGGVELGYAAGQPLRGIRLDAHVLDVGETLLEEELLCERRGRIAGRRAHEPHRGDLRGWQCRTGRGDADRWRGTGSDEAAASEYGCRASRASQQLASGDDVAMPRHPRMMAPFSAVGAEATAHKTLGPAF